MRRFLFLLVLLPACSFSATHPVVTDSHDETLIRQYVTDHEARPVVFVQWGPNNDTEGKILPGTKLFRVRYRAGEMKDVVCAVKGKEVQVVPNIHGDDWRNVWEAVSTK